MKGSLPSGFNYVSHENGSYDSGTGVWSVGDIEVGGMRYIEVTMEVLESMGISDEYMVSAEFRSVDMQGLLTVT